MFNNYDKIAYTVPAALKKFYSRGLQATTILPH